MCYDDVINKAKQFKSDTSQLVKSLKNLIHKGYDLSTIVYSLSHVYSVQLVGPNSNYISTFISVPQGSILGPLLLIFLLATSFILLNMVHCIIMLTITPCLM
jgi:hypothetical protein